MLAAAVLLSLLALAQAAAAESLAACQTTQTLNHTGGAPKPATQALGACQPSAEQPSASAQAAAQAAKSWPRGLIQGLLEVLGGLSR